MIVSRGPSPALPSFASSEVSGLIAKIWLAKAVGTFSTALAFFTMISMVFCGADATIFFWLVVAALLVGWATLYISLEESFAQIKSYAESAQGMRDVDRMRKSATELYFVFQFPPCFKRRFKVAKAISEALWSMVGFKKTKSEDNADHFDHYLLLLQQAVDASFVIERLKGSGHDAQRVANEEARFDHAIRAVANRLDDFEASCCWVENMFSKTALKLAGVFAFFVFVAAVLS